MTDTSVRQLSPDQVPVPVATGTTPPSTSVMLAVQTYRVDPPTMLLTVSGEVDLVSVDTLDCAVLGTATAWSGHRIVVDLRSVQFLGACGIAVLLAADQSARRHDGAVVVVLDREGPAARSLLRVPDLGLSIVADVEAALGAEVAAGEGSGRRQAARRHGHLPG